MVEIKNARELYKWGCEELKDLEPNCYSFEISQLLDAVCGINRNTLSLKGETPLSDISIEKFKAMVQRRLDREPLQYILGEWEFFSIPIKVGEGVLIPRPDTEILAQTAIDLINKNGYKSCADLCSGSGAIALAVHHNTKISPIYAIELSDIAYDYMVKNINMNISDDRITPIKADVLTYEFTSNLDMIVSNPPYIPAEDIPTLDEEVLREPIMALDGGKDGMDFYRALSKRCYNILNSGGAIAFEVGINQHLKVMEILKNIGYINIDFACDIHGIERTVYGFKE